MARFIAGDSLGALKAVHYTAPDAELTTATLLAGGPTRARAVQRLAARAAADNSDASVLLAAAHADGALGAHTLGADGALQTVRAWAEPRIKSGRFVGLTLADGAVYSCTSNGALRAASLDGDAPDRTAVLPMRLADWRLAPSGAAFAYAGDDVELSLWSAERAFTAPPPTPTPADASAQPKRKRAKNEALLPAETWRARNVPNDALGLRQPVRNTCLAFLGKDTEVAVGTAGGDVRRYDVRAARRPVADWVGVGRAGGVAAVACGAREHELFVSDNGTALLTLDARTGRVLNAYAGIAGAAAALAPGPRGLLASAARDRRVRVHSMPEAGADAKGKTLGYAYMQSEPGALVWDGVEMAEQAKGASEADGESDEEGDVWEGMEEVGDEESEDEEGGGAKKNRRKRVRAAAE